MKIGVIDSGLGGLSFLHEAIIQFPHAEYYYYADHAFCPYGNLSDNFLKERLNTVVGAMREEYSCEGYVLACNTATSLTIEHLRENYPQFFFVGIEPYINYINHNKDKQSGVLLCTPATANSSRVRELKDSFDPNNQIEVVSCPTLALAIEEGLTQGASIDWDKISEAEEISQKTRGKDFILLGCTHYEFIKNLLEKKFQVNCIGPNQAVVQQLIRVVEDKKGPLSLNFFSSGKLKNERERALSILKHLGTFQLDDPLWPRI